MSILFQKKLPAWLTQETVIAYALGAVVLWFGVNEVVSPKDWVGFVPLFLGSGTLAFSLVIAHGIALCACGISLFFNFYRRVAALVLVIIFAEIIVDLIVGGIASDIIVRDIGLWGMAIALLFKPQQN